MPIGRLAALAAFALLTPLAMPAAADARPVSVTARHAAGVPVRVVTVDLRDPHTVLDLGLPHAAPRANSAQETFGDESFGAMAARARAAVVMNGTFFSK